MAKKKYPPIPVDPGDPTDPISVGPIPHPERLRVIIRDGMVAYDDSSDPGSVMAAMVGDGKNPNCCCDPPSDCASCFCGDPNRNIGGCRCCYSFENGRKVWFESLFHYLKIECRKEFTQDWRLIREENYSQVGRSRIYPGGTVGSNAIGDSLVKIQAEVTTNIIDGCAGSITQLCSELGVAAGPMDLRTFFTWHRDPSYQFKIHIAVFPEQGLLSGDCDRVMLGKPNSFRATQDSDCRNPVIASTWILGGVVETKFTYSFTWTITGDGGESLCDPPSCFECKP